MSALDADSEMGQPRPRGTRPAPSPTRPLGLALMATFVHLAVWSCLEPGMTRATLAAQQESRVVSIPAQEDWVDYGTVLAAGELGAWDYQLFGVFAASVIKKDGEFFLYYQGANGYRIADGSVLWRSIGLATSTDGVNFEKHERNPILSRFPTGNGEEGATSAAAVVGPDQQIALYYGANRRRDRTPFGSMRTAVWPYLRMGWNFSISGR